MTTAWVLGSATFDLFASGLPRLPVVDNVGDEFTDESLVHLPAEPVFSVGGNGGNVAYVLARLGVPTHLCTSIGDDPLGQALLQFFRGVGCEVALVPPGRTSVNFVATDELGGRRSFFYPVAIDAQAASTLAQTAPLAANDHVFFAGYPHPAAEVFDEWIRRARMTGAGVSLDIGPTSAGFRLSRLSPLLHQLDFLFCNERELAALDTTQDPERLADDIAGQLRVGLVLKKGSAGSEFRNGSGRYTAPATRVGCATTVGAGDAFDAGFIFATLVGGKSPTAALRFASDLVALQLERGHGVSGAPTADEVADHIAAAGAEPPAQPALTQPPLPPRASALGPVSNAAKAACHGRAKEGTN